MHTHTNIRTSMFLLTLEHELFMFLVNKLSYELMKSSITVTVARKMCQCTKFQIN